MQMLINFDILSLNGWNLSKEFQPNMKLEPCSSERIVDGLSEL